MNCTFYRNTYSEADLDVPLLSMLQTIKDGKYAEKVAFCRSITDQEERRKYKASNLPAFTASGTFDGKKANTLKEHSGFIAIDFDQLDDIDEARSMLYADEYTYAGFVSVSGAGLCIIVKIDGKQHIRAFEGLERYYLKKYDLILDDKCKNVNRLRFVSHDPELYLNTKSNKFSEYLQKPKGRRPNITNFVYSQTDFEYILQQIQQQGIDLTENYGDWISIGQAIYSEFGEAGEPYFHAVSQYHPEYKESTTSRKYKSFKGVQAVTISTFFYHAKKAGIEITTPKTKLIGQVATMAKKTKATKEQVIKQLHEQDGISPEQSKEIIDQVYDQGASVEGENEDLISQIEIFMKRNLSIRFNEITLKYEANERPMTDRDFNTAYLNCKQAIPKISKDLFLSAIDSDRTPVHNPIKAFFRQYKNRNPKGLIRSLSDCIESNTGGLSDPQEFKYRFIRKWMIGAVAMWHKGHSPLMLVLAGDKQNTGKSHFFRYLLPQELQPYYAEAELTGDKDENLMMCSKILIMNDEMSNKSKRDITMMKKLCSAQWFNLRKPYGKLSEDFRRIAALCGTSNALELLSDPTGNRRIIPIEVLSIKHAKYNEINKTDLWVEAYLAYEAGESYHLNAEDIDLLNKETEDFNEASAEFELFSKYFRKPEYGEVAQLFTNSDIKTYIEKLTNQRLSAKKLGMELKRMGFNKLHKKINGAQCNVYEVIETQSGYREQKNEVPF